MIPILFEGTVHEFTGHGLGDLIDATEVIAEENSDDGHSWEMSFIYPRTGELFDAITLNRIVVAKVNSYQDPQAFRIYSVVKNLDQSIEVKCQHLSYDLACIPTKPMKTVGATTSIATLPQKMFDVGNKQYFTFETDIADPENIPDQQSEAERDAITLEFDEPKSALSVLLDGDDSIKGKFGGDIVTDNFSFKIKEVAGEDRGVTINYGIDLVDFNQEREISGMITGILPYYIREKDIKLDIDATKHGDIKEVGGAMCINENAYTLEQGSKYTLTFTPEETGGQAELLAASGFPHTIFNMDGKKKEYEIIPNSNITVAANTNLIVAKVIPTMVDPDTHESVPSDVGSLSFLEITKNYLEPILYGNITNGPGEYNNYPKIEPVDLTDYFPNPEREPTTNEISAKAQEYIDQEEIGIPEVTLTVSYAPILDQDVRMYDAVRVRFVKMGVDVKSKVTRYKYDVLQERCVEIDVGKTKDSALFTLQDASRLRHGLLPPDRIAKESIGTSHIKKGSIGADQIGKSAIGGWNMPPDIIDHDLLGENAVGKGNLSKGWHTDPVLQSVPDNVYGGYDKKVGYLFDPSLGVPPDGMFGWTETDGQGQKHFHSVTEFKNGIPVAGGGSGVGYVLDPAFIFPESINAEAKLTAKSVDNTRIKDYTIEEEKFADGALVSAIYAHDGERKLKAWLNLYDGVGAEGIPIADDRYVSIEFLKVTNTLELMSDFAMHTQYMSVPIHFAPHQVYVDDILIPGAWILSNHDIYIYTGSSS